MVSDHALLERYTRELDLYETISVQGLIDSHRRICELVVTSYLNVPVAIVKEMAKLTLVHQQNRVDRRLHDMLVKRNAEAVAYNSKASVRLLKRKKCEIIEDIPSEIARIKASFSKRKIPWDTTEGYILACTTSEWWEKLEHFANLPEEDQDALLLMSVEDLQLINYTTHRAANA